MKIPFSPPFVDDDVLKEVADTLRSGWITTGPKVKALEQEINKLTGCQQTLCVNSWTSGAILTLKWLGVKAGDEVIVPAYTYAATALSVIHCGATPILVDVLPDFNIDPAAVAKAITAKTKAIIAVDIAGLMCDYDRLKEIVSAPEALAQFNAESDVQQKMGRVMVIADAAHSIGAKYKHLNSGVCADVNIFSMHAVKNITTAEGGAISLHLPASFNAQEVYELMRLWSLNGQTKDAFSKSNGSGWRYDILFDGLKVNMPDICAAIGLAQIKKYNHNLIVERKRIAQQYEAYFTSRSWAQLPILKDEHRETCYHLYALRIVGITEIERDEMIAHIVKLGVAVNVHFLPLPMLTTFKNKGFDIKDFPVSYDNYAREISLPIYPQLTTEQVNFICSAVEDSYHTVKASEKIA
ncbi:DegT/DnrJ/EryC1/StrS family aminotransferase [Pedobacter insulae]|uniref:dTDP-4-amino-4,6-dideoxygalactose transaminase n=1 Tax=Pedobacter insulae TaxID=414048 RepID=A0A1I2TBL8_9SPHI|nr:DegT/DnrJ/EryC1/StrS family aminotransferase [Pedobacter insulae]SFG62208.1 dTDP-4-amino-4,6-dideoxygalactose transaminase [Pedobacter insulae]